MNRSLDAVPYQPFETEHHPKPPEDVPEDTLEHFPLEVRKQATEHMLELMRGLLRGVDGYAIFASTGMYIQGERIGDKDMCVPPGDLDVAVDNVVTLEEIVRRLRKVDGVTFIDPETNEPTDGVTQPFPGQDAKVLSGRIMMQVGSTVVLYPFEFFVEDRIVTSEVFRHRENIKGLNVLKLEGLKGQYSHNEEFDSRLVRSVREVAEYLSAHEDELQNAMEGKGDRALLDVLLETYEITEAELQEVLMLQKRLPSTDGKEREQIESSLSKMLGGVKTKVAKRLRNIQQLQSHLDV